MTTTPAHEQFETIKANLLNRLEIHMAPFHLEGNRAANLTAVNALTSAEHESWATIFMAAAEPFEKLGDERAAAGDPDGAREAYLSAYVLQHAGRFPSPLHSAKYESYIRSVANFRKAGGYFDPPLEVVTQPFAGRADEGDAVTFYVRRRKDGPHPAPVVIRWGGVDTWKEERMDYLDAFLAAGFATIAIDMPGVGESPVVGSRDAERQFAPLFDWILTQPDLDAARVQILGMSYGGYWATKVAHLYADRLLAAVNWGGGVHTAFSRDWCIRSGTATSYLMCLGESRARTVGKKTYEEYIDVVAGFSLVDQGVLERPHPPMLLVNGRDDRQVPVEDMLLLLDYGKPKAARFFPGGHMGYGPQTFPCVLAWMKERAGLTE